MLLFSFITFIGIMFSISIVLFICEFRLLRNGSQKMRKNPSSRKMKIMRSSS